MDPESPGMGENPRYLKPPTWNRVSLSKTKPYPIISHPCIRVAQRDPIEKGSYHLNTTNSKPEPTPEVESIHCGTLANKGIIKRRFCIYNPCRRNESSVKTSWVNPRKIDDYNLGQRGNNMLTSQFIFFEGEIYVLMWDDMTKDLSEKFYDFKVKWTKPSEPDRIWVYRWARKDVDSGAIFTLLKFTMDTKNWEALSRNWGKKAIDG